MTKITHYIGTISTTGKGTGFVAVDGLEEDILIEPGNTGTALHGDTVEVQILPDSNNDRLTGKVTKLIERNLQTIVGTVDKKSRTVFVLPDNYKIHKDVFLPGNQSDLVKDGDKVLVKVVKWESVQKNPLGEVVKVLGQKGEHEAEMQSILADNNIDTDFPRDVQLEAEQLSNNRDELFEQALNDPYRRDLRDLIVLTIDPVDAKDFDDALSIEKLGEDHLKIGVHIADVSYFVTRKSALDREAFKRSFSTYLVDRTVPMLPPELSNDLCSLNPNVDRLAFSGFFEFKNNKLVSSEFSKSIIHSNKRYSYEQAQEVIEGGDDEYDVQIRTLNNLALILKDRRVQNGAIEFGDEEVKFELDATGKPIAVYQKIRQEAHKMVEEFMLLCNQEAAKWFENKSKELGSQALSVFRTHDYPDRDKLIELNKFIKTLGYDGLDPKELANDKIRHAIIQKLLENVANTPIEDLTNNQMLRAMAKAGYGVLDKGHFGLAFDNYLHFTSPIRRYPDLLVHRALDSYLRNQKPPAEDTGYYQNAAKQASLREIQTVDAERASIAYKQVEYLQDHVGEEFTGIISGVSQYGLFIEETTTKAQGLVRIKTMDDFYEFKPESYALIGQKTGQKYHIGDEVQVKLTEANLDRRQLDFELIKKI